MRRPLRLGLTGGIASGKSTVAAVLAERGARVIDADAIAHSVTAPGGSAIDAIRSSFGEGMITAEGALDRERMRALAFSDPSARARLQRIVHPLVQAGMEAAAAVQPQAAATVFDIPLLAESSHWRRALDRVLVVDCDAPTQLARVMARNGWPLAQAEAVLAAQASRAVRLRVADAVVFNGTGITTETLRRQIADLAPMLGL